jgi:Family of unknown function (DUF6962)
MLLQTGIQPQDPTTFITDLILTIESLFFGFMILRLWKQKNTSKEILIWIGTFLSISVFSLCGAISHGTKYVETADLFWPPTMIFGGLAFFFFNIGAILYVQKEEVKKHLILPIIFLVIYLIALPLLNWMFGIFVGYQLLCSILIYKYTIPVKENLDLCPSLIKGLSILLFAGGIQAIGSLLGLEFLYGSNSQFIFKPHNDVFHLIAAVGLFVIFKGLQNYYSK